MLDEYTRECPPIGVGTRLRSQDVILALHSSRPTARSRNGFVESFNGKLRDEPLNHALHHLAAAMIAFRKVPSAINVIYG